MTELEQILDGLERHLLDERGFSPSALNEADYRKLAAATSGLLTPLRCFREWLRRCPEALDWLRDLKAGRLGAARMPAPPTPLTFRCRLGTIEAPVRLLEVCGPLLKVQALTAEMTAAEQKVIGGGAIDMIRLDQVAEPDRQRVRDGVRNLPGADTELVWEGGEPCA